MNAERATRVRPHPRTPFASHDNAYDVLTTTKAALHPSLSRRCSDGAEKEPGRLMSCKQAARRGESFRGRNTGSGFSMKYERNLASVKS